ncbi:piggyBac transposable element-derived protein 4-like [Colias croceus]|uniref:piggyBac transposable element-derived protein 4-like n=1 Tax=Colias crocea TaxID=72248 RepID=UPI001E27A596|nr:piggyBac transposable element-derived protein 4-like [Colias croceus]
MSLNTITKYLKLKARSDGTKVPKDVCDSKDLSKKETLRRSQTKAKAMATVAIREEVQETVKKELKSSRKVSPRLSPADKKRRIFCKQLNELQRVRLPDAPLRKRHSLKFPSPEREPCELVAPQPLSSGQVFAMPSQPSTSQDYPLSQPSTSRQPTPPLIILPPDVDFVNMEDFDVAVDIDNDSFDAITTDINNMDFILDSDSDADMDVNIEESGELPTDIQIEIVTDTDLTLPQEQFLQAEDIANDQALQHLLPEDCLRFDWDKDRSTFKGQREQFTGTPGPTFEVTKNSTPIDIFHKMFDVEFIDLLCEETNRYARQKIESGNLSSSSRQHRWTPTDRAEMISFLSLMILQGLYPLPREESYFSFNGFGTMPYFSKIMSYNRYNLLKSMLHFVDNNKLTDKPTRSKLCKIQTIIDYFNQKFSSLYYPRQEIAIDESLLKWHGKLSFTQKINTKAAQVGIKTYELCESSSGYLWRFIVYAGKNKPTMTDNDDSDDDTETRPNQTEQTGQTEQTNQADQRTDMTDFQPTNATSKIVFDLIEPLLHRGHSLVMDNFYNCPLLARCLKLRKTDCYGTQRLNREFIPSSIRTLTKTDLREGEVIATYCSDLSLTVFRGAKLVCMISTYHSLQIGTRIKHNKIAYKPSVVLDYNKHMGGIDRKDQYLSAHPLERVRSRVWYKKLFRHLFSTAIFNCFVIYNSKHKIAHRQFRTVLAETLLKTYRQIDLTTERRVITRTRTVGKKTTPHATTTMLNRPDVEGDHFPIHSDVKRGRCWYCAHVRNISSRTVWQCMECRVNLCIIGCFRDYHKQ